MSHSDTARPAGIGVGMTGYAFTGRARSGRFWHAESDKMKGDH